MNRPIDITDNTVPAVSDAGRWKHVFGAIDLGTNNCRLLIANPCKTGFQVADSFSRIVRLGEGIGTAGELSQSAIVRTIDALKVCSNKMKANGVSRYWAVATAACRHATNREKFTRRVYSETGIKFDIISPAEEARLAVAGCVSLFDKESDYAFVFDIGGGSTELIWVTICETGQCKILALASLPIGVVTLAEEYGGKTVTPETYAAMVRDVERRLAPFEAKNSLSSYIKNGQVQMIGTSGTVTTVAGIYLGLERYDRNRVDGVWMERDHITSISKRLASMTYEARKAEPCIGKDRADLVVAGCAIWEAISNTWKCDKLRVADRGLREGMLIELMANADRNDTSMIGNGRENLAHGKKAH